MIEDRMKFFVVGFLLLGTAVAHAQQASPELQTAALQALQTQRNNALDQAAGLAAQLQVTTKELNDLKAADAKKADAEKKPEPQK
jgi:hypothetical protein